MSDYNLNKAKTEESLSKRIFSFLGLLRGENKNLITAVFAVLINSGATILTPFLISLAIDSYISKNNLDGLNTLLIGLVAMYLVVMVVSYLQTRLVGQVSQRVLFKLRADLFDHLQNLPVAFFQENKAGDVITRVNSDTDKISNFLSGSIFQFVSSFVVFIGIGVFIFFLNWPLALVVWSAVFLVFGVSQAVSKFVKKTNDASLKSNGEMTGFLDENFNNFKALVAFNKGGYLRDSFADLNRDNFKKTTLAQILNSLYNPFYNFSGNIAQLMVLAFGLYFYSNGSVSIGLLIGFITYTQKFYEPLRTLGNIWGSLQESLSAWGRVDTLLKIK